MSTQLEQSTFNGKAGSSAPSSTVRLRQEDDAPLAKMGRKEIQEAYSKGTRLFSRLDLSNTKLKGVVLNGVTFDSCIMSGADLSGAQLTGATFKGSSLLALDNVDFKNAALEGAMFLNVDLSMARNFESADLLWTKYLGMVNAMTESQFSAVKSHIETGVRKYAAGSAVVTEIQRLVGDLDRNIVIVNPITILERK